MQPENPSLEKTLYEKFYTDPSWADIEAKIMSYVNELEDMSTLNENQEAHHLKSEIKARKIAKERLVKFLQDCGIIRANITREPKASFK